MAWLIARRELLEVVRDFNLLIPLVVLPGLMGFITGMTALTSVQATSEVGTAVTNAVLDQLPDAVQRRLVEVPTTTSASAGEVRITRDITVGTLLKAAGIPLFWIIAAALTPALAADSFVGERERRTAEPLLATPIRNGELILGKLMAGAIPAVMGTWLGTLVFAAFVAVSGSPYYPRFIFADTDWLFSTLVIVPLMALFAAAVGALVSTRVSSFRVAYQLNGLLVLPLILVIVPQSVFLFLLTGAAFVYVAGALLLADVVLVAWALRIFDRERMMGFR